MSVSLFHRFAKWFSNKYTAPHFTLTQKCRNMFIVICLFLWLTMFFEVTITFAVKEMTLHLFVLESPYIFLAVFMPFGLLSAHDQDHVKDRTVLYLVYCLILSLDVSAFVHSPTSPLVARLVMLFLVFSLIQIKHWIRHCFCLLPAVIGMVYNGAQTDSTKLLLLTYPDDTMNIAGPLIRTVITVTLVLWIIRVQVSHCEHVEVRLQSAIAITQEIGNILHERRRTSQNQDEGEGQQQQQPQGKRQQQPSVTSVTRKVLLSYASQPYGEREMCTALQRVVQAFRKRKRSKVIESPTVTPSNSIIRKKSWEAQLDQLDNLFDDDEDDFTDEDEVSVRPIIPQNNSNSTSNSNSSSNNNTVALDDASSPTFPLLTPSGSFQQPIFTPSSFDAPFRRRIAYAMIDFSLINNTASPQASVGNVYVVTPQQQHSSSSSGAVEAQKLSSLLNNVYRYTSATRGTVHSFIGDTLHVTWNAAQQVSIPERLAVRALHVLSKKEGKDDSGNNASTDDGGSPMTPLTSSPLTALRVEVYGSVMTGFGECRTTGTLQQTAFLLHMDWRDAQHALHRYARTVKTNVVCRETAKEILDSVLLVDVVEEGVEIYELVDSSVQRVFHNTFKALIQTCVQGHYEEALNTLELLATDLDRTPKCLQALERKIRFCRRHKLTFSMTVPYHDDQCLL